MSEGKENPAAPLCEKHSGGHRSKCLVCAGQELQSAISRISYIIGEPNEMEVSSYDLHYDETVVVEAVRHKIQTMQAQLDRLRDLLKRAHPLVKLYHFREDGLKEAIQREVE